MNCKDCGVDSVFLYIDKKSQLCDNCRAKRTYKETKRRRNEID